MAALTPSPTFSSPDSDATEPAEEQSVGEEEEEEEEEEEDLQDDVFPEHVLCDGRDKIRSGSCFTSVHGLEISQ